MEEKEMTKQDQLITIAKTGFIIILIVSAFIIGLVINRTFKVNWCMGFLEGGRVVAEAVGKEVRFVN